MRVSHTSELSMFSQRWQDCNGIKCCELRMFHSISLYTGKWLLGRVICCQHAYMLMLVMMVWQ